MCMFDNDDEYLIIKRREWPGRKCFCPSYSIKVNNFMIENKLIN